jgi:hypothetical protein
MTRRKIMMKSEKKRLIKMTKKTFSQSKWKRDTRMKKNKDGIIDKR